MKKKTYERDSKGNGAAVKLELHDGAFDMRPEIFETPSANCLRLKINNHAWQGDRQKRRQSVEITLSYGQAKALAETLINFCASRKANRDAIIPVHVSSGGAIKWSEFPYPII